MNTQQAIGRDAQRTQGLALRIELGLPVGTTGTSELTFGAVRDITMPLLKGLACKAVEDRHDALFAVYESEDATVPAWYFLLYRELIGVSITKVEPAAIGRHGSLVLITQDRQRQFALNDRGVLKEVPVASAACRPRAHHRAAERIAAIAEALGPVLDAGGWQSTTFALQRNGSAIEFEKVAA